jgi:hypothetical protein
MNGVTAAMLVVLGLAGSLRVPDLQVEAASTSGTVLPDLAEAVGRALVAGGARVVLRGPISGPCPYCAKVVVKETGAGTCRVEVSQDRHFASATLRLPPGSPLFDRARAIAIQARLLVTWDTSSEGRGKDVVVRAPAHKPEVATTAPRADERPESARVEAAPPPVPEYEPLPAAEPGPAPDSVPPALTSRREDAAPVAPAKPADRTTAKPSPASGPKPLTRAGEPDPEIRRPATRQPPPLDTTRDVATPPAPPKPQWPWIPTAIGASAAVAAGMCALVARNRYDSLSDSRLTLDSAKTLKSEGESWQLASFVLSGAAAVGLGVGIVGFATRSPVTAVASPLPGGGMVAVGGGLP